MGRITETHAVAIITMVTVNVVGETNTSDFDAEGQLEVASTHQSARTHAGKVFVPRDFGLWPLDPEINGFSGLMETPKT